ncbi:microtubule-associated protein 1B-like isoform X2 [Osmerus mordax]|uniref:microtubule-associated protein 1B-like isoform X2 n=1 Tax=Osmerus mordax TaxID=8014 RepID=UPI00350FC34F
MTTYFCLLVSVLICKNYADITMTPHTTKNPTPRVKNTVIKRRNKKDEKKDKKGEKNKKNEMKNKETKSITMTPHTTKNPTTRVKNTVIKRRNKKDKKKDKKGEKNKKNGKKNKNTKNITMTPHTTKNPTTRVKNTDIATSPHTTKNPTTRVKNTVTTRIVSVGEESEATKKDENENKKSEKNKSHWQLPVGVTTGGLVLVLVLLLVGFLIRRRWAQKAEGDRDRPQAVYAEISDVTQQPKDESCECSSRSKEHFVYSLASAQGTQKEVISMNPIYHTIQDPNITTNLNNGENPYFLAQNPDVPETSFD